MKLERMIIYTKDIQRITGKSDRYARKIMIAIRNKIGKEKHQLISVKEFSDFMKLSEEEVSKYLGK